MFVLFSTHFAQSQSFISPVFTFDTKPPIANLLSPNGGQVVNNTAPLTVTWTATDDNLKPNPITLQLITQPGNNSYILAQNIANTGSATVNLPAIITTQAKIRVVAKDMFGNEGVDESNAFFTINGTLVWVTVQGTIKDINTGAGIGGAAINLTGQSQNYSANSLPNGSYTFGSVLSGYYNLSVTKTGYESYNSYVSIIGPNTQTINVNLTPGNSTSLTINPSLTAYADNIVENPPGFFTLTGNVSINNILYFSGVVKIDKRSYLVKPEISGSGTIFSKNIAGFTGDYILKGSSVSYVYKINDNNLEPKTYAGFIDGTPSIGGFSMTIGQFVIDPAGDFAECRAIVEMPYPIDEIFGAIETENPDDPSFYVSEVGSSIIVSHTNGVDMSADISASNINLGLVNIEELTLYFNTAEQLYGGSISMVIPGLPEAIGDQLDSLPKGIDSLPVEVRDENGKIISQTTFGDFVDMKDAFGLKFLKIGFEIEFVQGAINKLIVTLGAKIPIDGTGLFITEMTGGVDDLAQEDWKIMASVDVETGLELPVLGSPIKLDNFGVLIHPMSYFKGSGSFQVFGQTVTDGSIEYDHSLSSLKGQCNLNLNGILTGEQKFSLQGGRFSGSSLFSVHTPDDLPWYLNWAENIAIGSAFVELHNYTFQSETKLPLISLAQRITFGKNSFPWFHYELGTNLKNLFQIWKGHRNGKQSIIFEVPENASGLMVVAMDSINPQLFDFSLINPSGKIFDSGNTAYQQFADAKQTVMRVDMPVDGDWQFVTSYAGNVAIYTSAPNQKPTGMVNQPGTKQALSNQVSLSFNDYDDTIHMEVYYDTDRKNFDGSFIDDFSIVNNATLSFEWQNENLPNGEYYIYSRIDDGVNTPVLQYAPGSILVMNDPSVETPVDFLAVQQGDSVVVSWDAPLQANTYGTIVYYMDKSTQNTEEKSVTDSTNLVLKGLAPGHGYEIWSKFSNAAGFYGQNSNVQNLVFASGSANNPPYFTSDRDSTFVFIAGEPANYTLLASDADGNPLSFNLPGDTLGISVNGNQLNWSPTPDQKGAYKVMIVVSDGTTTDTTWQKLVVYTPEQVAVDLSFSSVRLYEQDNMFITIRNFFCPDDDQTVIMTNTRSGQQTTVLCSRVNEFEYIGQFELTFTKSIAISVANGDSLKATYSWDGDDYQTFAYFDSLPQPSDQTPPGIIGDLNVERLPGNQVKLTWTSTGNDGAVGKAYRYHIRYAGQPIATEPVYFTALLIGNPPYPSESGVQDSLIINLADLQPNSTADSVYFAIKATDEMQNWGALGNSPGLKRLVVPTNITAQVTGMVNISLDWDGPVPVQPPVNGFLYYELFRGINNGSLLLYQTGITQTSFTDSLRDYPDGRYQYAIQAVYAVGNSDTILAPEVNLHRFVNVNVLAGLEWANSNEGISMQMTGLDTIYYSQTFTRVTNNTGLMLMGNVFKTTYAIQLTKTGYISVFDTILVSADPSEFEYVLARNIPATINLQNINLPSGLDSCFEATQTITVAGSGTEFNVQNGASVNLVAGQKIILLPVSKVFSGGNLHTFITPNNQYCSSFKILPFQNPEDDDKNTFFKIYPNPTEGRFVVELTKELEGSGFKVQGSRFKVRVYNLFGVEALEEQIITARLSEFSLQNQPPGIYIIRVFNGNQSGTSKIIKL